ncbi:MAG: DUF551 domain-containing protein [Erysipelotrichaceae bacterium]|nr:DUF551 domain-containing protein [Erysipelotrichaceae bacterium]
MDDLISRAEAMDASEKFIKDCNPDHFVGHQKFIEYMDNAEIGSFGKWQFANGFNMGLTAVEVAIKKLPSAQQWIPCSERLPKYDETVLVWYCGETRIGYLTDISENDVWVLHGSFPFKHDEKKVVAWMELPEPYEVGK